jgi:hypothetical protein
VVGGHCAGVALDDLQPVGLHGTCAAPSPNCRIEDAAVAFARCIHVQVLVLRPPSMVWVSNQRLGTRNSSGRCYLKYINRNRDPRFCARI